MIIFAKIRISIDYKVFILLNVHPAADADMFLKMLEMKKRPQTDTNESLNC